MSAAGPWDSPRDDVAVTSREATTRVVSVVGAWMAAGAVTGVALGSVLLLTRAAAGAPTLGGVGGVVLGAVLGGAALAVERSQAAERPALLDQAGRWSRPLHGALFGLPVFFAVPSLTLLGVAGSVGLNQAAPAVGFGATALFTAWIGLRVLASHRYTRALEALELQAEPEARARLQGLAEARWAPRTVRVAARLNLGMLALQRGDADEALRWYPPDPRDGAWAHTGRALAWLMRGDTSRAANAIGEAAVAAGARHVQEQIDALRVLLVWRTDGAAEARAVGERLLGPQATPLHRALLAALGDERFADDAEARALARSGLGRALPELTASGSRTR